MDIKATIRNLPDSPGVYIMRDNKGKVIYIGKAGSLRKRVFSYFTKRCDSPRLRLLVSSVNSIDRIVTGSEAEALIYEASLIKQFKPKFNVELKDDKSYPYLKLTLNEKYSRLFITRRVDRDGARYYGPYTDVKLLRSALSFIKRVFPLRQCRTLGKRLCISYYVSECAGPCMGKIGAKSYKKIVNELVLFLEGKRQRLLNEFSRRMEKVSRSQKYEEAIRIRNRIRALSTLVVKRSVPGPMDQIDELKYLLGLMRRPKRIEAFDVSDIRGKMAVGSMVSFYDGEPDKNNYRKYKIRFSKGADDYKMMREIVRRRYARLLEEKKGLPDLIIIDGGKGHLSSAVKELKALKIARIPAIGIAKKFEHIYLPRRPLPIVLPKDSSVLQLIKRMRDEAHRFAKRYHVSLRSKGIPVSELDNIKGIGRTRKRSLITFFGSVNKVKNATFEELLMVQGINEKNARDIIQHFKQ